VDLIKHRFYKRGDNKMSNNYVLNKEAMGLGLKLFEMSIKQNQELGNSLMESYKIEAEEAKGDLKFAYRYIRYVQECIKLQVIPRDMDYWEKWII
jgi:hypothetical protein